MKKACIILLLALVLETQAQEEPAFTLQTDHLAILVDDLSASAKFYREIMGLNEITNQTRDPRIRWFAFADGREMHLIGRGKQDVLVKKDIHLAVAVSDLEAFRAHLERNDVYYENWQGKPGITNSRPDGILQVYVQDPDGYWIEVNTVPHR